MVVLNWVSGKSVKTVNGLLQATAASVSFTAFRTSVRWTARTVVALAVNMGSVNENASSPHLLTRTALIRFRNSMMWMALMIMAGPRSGSVKPSTWVIEATEGTPSWLTMNNM